MATCPNCGHDVLVPWYMRLSGWSWRLHCPHCRRTLQYGGRAPAVLAAVAAVLLVRFIGHGIALPETIALIAVALLLVASMGFMRPKVRLYR